MLPKADQLNIAALSRIFDKKSESYKLFWFQAILNRVCDGDTEITFETLIDEMITEAWYMVTEYHLNLGPSDTLEKTVAHIESVSGLRSTSKKDEIMAWLRQTDDDLVLKYKKDLTLNVPYRLQAPFLEDFRTDTWKCGQEELAFRVNRQRGLIYTFGPYERMNTRILIDPEWKEYLLDNREIVQGWIRYNMVIYLQRRNPSVPGISDKLYPPQERKLDKVKKYWKLLAGTEEFREIYGGLVVIPREISIDHFVPWSYVAHDELWNLHPTTRAINSSKSNNLPDWDRYFDSFAALEYHSYRMMWRYEKVHDVFETCAREHLNNNEIRQKLYGEGLDGKMFRERLADVMTPVYQSALSCGFREWRYENE